MTKNLLLITLATFIALAGGYYYFYLRESDDLEDLVYGNGRIEAQSVDIATRNGGRVLSVPVEEGQMVQAGDVVATLDLTDLAASVTGAKANVRARIQQKEAAASSVAQAESSLTLAEREFTRADALVRQKAMSESVRDQAINAKQANESQLSAAKQNLSSAEESIQVAEAEVARLEDLLTDQNLKASRSGRVLYKLVEPGEVISAGGKAVTLLDLTDVYMTIFLPTETVGKLQLKQEARIILDAMPDTVIPAYISYISPEAQFTPRQVETRTEREKLTFRVKIRIPPALLSKYADKVKTGLPGIAYLRADQTKAWPSNLTVDPALLPDSEAKP